MSPCLRSSQPGTLRTFEVALSLKSRLTLRAAAIARHSHSLETLVTYFGQLVDLASNEVDVATPESDICGFDFGSFTSVSSLAMRMPRVLDQSISRRLPPRLKHLQFDCDFHEGNIKAPCFISLADEKRGKLPCLETITCWHDGPVFKLTNLKNPEFLQALAVMADIGEALGERGVVFTYSGWQRDC